MKITFTLTLLFFSIFSFGQDTTSFRMIGVSSNGTLDYFASDSTSLGSLEISADISDGYAIFQDANGLLYAVLYDGNNNQGERNLYQVNPLSGAFTLIKDFTNGYVNSADIGPDGTIYFITGNGNATDPNKLFTYDLNTDVETLLSESFMQGSRALEFNTLDSNLYLYEGYESNLGDYTEKLFIYDLSNNTSSNVSTTGLYDEIHGAYFNEENNTFFISAYGGELYTTDATYLNGTLYHETFDGVTGNNIMDLTLLKMLMNSSIEAVCPGDSVQLISYFGGVNFKWFLDGNEIIGATDSSMYVSAPGIYSALVEIQMEEQTNYMWSEEITVTAAAVPVVAISSAGNDMLICPDETIVLTGASGGTLQWSLDGVDIIGANSSTYSAAEPGAYNQTKINTSGCIGTDDQDFVITSDPNCFSGIEEMNNVSLSIYPNPTNGKIQVDFSGVQSNEFILLDVTGKVILKGKLVQGENYIDLSAFNSGIYLLSVENSFQRILKN